MPELSCDELITISIACINNVRANFVNAIADASAILNGNKDDKKSLGIIADKLNVFCDYNPDDEDVIRLKDKAIAVLRGALGVKLFGFFNKCFNVNQLFLDWARDLLNNVMSPNGSATQLCNNISGQGTFFGEADCAAANLSCVSALTSWTVPNNCMRDTYTLSGNFEERQEETGLPAAPLTPKFILAKKDKLDILAVFCDSSYDDIFLIREGQDENGNIITPSCRGTIFAKFATKGFEGVEPKVYLDLNIRYENKQDQLAKLRSLPAQFIKAYKAYFNDLLPIIDEEVNTAKTNAGKWLANLKGGVNNLAGAIEKRQNSTMQQYIVDIFQARAGNYHRYASGPNRLTCGNLHASQIGLGSEWWKKVDAANKCIDKILKAAHPECKVQSTEYVTAGEIANKGLTLPENINQLTPELVAWARALIQRPTLGTQCDNVDIVSVVPNGDGGVAITYIFRPSLAWDRGKMNEYLSNCNNGEIASFMGDLVQILNATRTPRCGQSPLEYLVVDSQDLGRPIKRIGDPSPEATREAAICLYTWPNEADQNFGNPGNGPVGPGKDECSKYAMPTNCLHYPSIFNQAERFGFSEFFLILSVILPRLNIRNNDGDALAIWNSIKQNINASIKEKLDVKLIQACIVAGIDS